MAISNGARVNPLDLRFQLGTRANAAAKEHGSEASAGRARAMHATSDWLTPPVEQQQSLPRTRVPSFDGREESKYLFNTYEDIQKDLLKSLLHFAGSHARVSEWCGLGIQAAALQPLTRWSERPAVHKVRFSRLRSFISSPSHNTIHQPLCTTLANHRENVTSSPLPSTFITSYPDSLLY